MSTVKVGTTGSGGTSAIPANARKVVQDLKEVVKNSDEEIYAMLKECNMDPNETVQRLISQDTFHEVKRKRDRKKENVNKDSGEVRSTPAVIGPSFRGGRVADRGAGSGTFTPQYNSSELANGSRQSLPGRENGIYQSTIRASTASPGVPSSSQSHAQFKPVSSGTSTVASVSMTSDFPVINDGSLPYARTSQGSHSTWSAGPGHATLADVVKSNNASQTTAAALPAVAPTVQASTSHVSQHFISSGLEVLSGVYPSPTDPVFNSLLESHASGSLGAIKRDVGTVGSQRSIREQGPSVSVEGTIKSSPSTPEQVSEPTACVLDVSSTDTATIVSGPNSPVSLASSLSQERSISTADGGNAVGVKARLSSSSGVTGTGGVRTALLSNQYINRPVYQRQQQPVGTQKAGSGLEWKPKPLAQNAVSSQAAIGTPSVSDAIRLSPPASPSNALRMVSAAVSKLQGFSFQDDQPVTIPNHLQVPEADRTCLSFGSFGAGFGTTFSASFGSEDNSKGSNTVEDPTPVEEITAEEPIEASLTESTPASYNHQSTSNDVDPSASSSDVLVSYSDSGVSAITSVPAASPAEPSKPARAVQQSPQYSYLPTVPNYSGLGVASQTVGVQYSYEPTESQPQEVSRLQSFVQQSCSDPTNFYSPVFRANTDGEVRYPHFISTNATSKYNGAVTLLSGQSLSSSHEGGNAVALSATGPTAQTSQTAGIVQTTLTMPQQHLPIHAYPGQPAGVPISPFATNVFGYQYMPPSYTYMHTPYQHNYTGNTGYAQPPAGSSYAPAAASNAYPPAAAAMKYHMPQYKNATAAGNAPHAAVAAGYGSYTTAPSVFAVNPSVSAGNASSYDDVSGPQYKEGNLYIPSQQAEGSAVWIQAQLSRDMAGLQTNSYYNIPGQGQQTGYMHTQAIHTHPAAAYASLYHPSQSGPAPNAHQLLQQQQALGTIGAAGAQAGAYHQPQRGQMNWANSY